MKPKHAALALLAASCATTLTPASWGSLPSAIDGPGGEAWLAHDPAGDLILFGRHDSNWANHRLFMTRRVEDVWSEPEQVSFTQDLDGTSPHFAPDGRSVLFVSRRPRPGAPTAAPPDRNVWRVSWNGSSWGEPQPLPEPINSTAEEIDAVEVANGRIYFTSMREGSQGEGANRSDIYVAIPTPSGYRVELVTTLNTAHAESTLYVTPDERYMVFGRQEDPAGLGKDDLFFSSGDNGQWTTPLHIDGDANSPEFEYSPELSPDGSTLYLTTHREGHAGIISVPFAAYL